MQTESSPRISLQTRRRGLLAAAIAAAMAIVPAGAQAAARAEVVTPKPVTAEVVQPQLATPAQAPSSAPAPAPAPAAAAPESSAPAPSAAQPAASRPGTQGSGDLPGSLSSSGDARDADATMAPVFSGWLGRLLGDPSGRVESTQWLAWLKALSPDGMDQVRDAGPYESDVEDPIEELPEVDWAGPFESALISSSTGGHIKPDDGSANSATDQKDN